MIRILHCVNIMNRAGLETMLMNYYRHIDRTKIQFDFLAHRPERADYDDEIESLGGKIYRAPRLYPQNYPAYFAFMKQFFREHPEYKIIHSHIDAMSYLPLLAAKRAGVPVRIAHSHSTSIDRDYKFLLKQYFRYQIPYVANEFFACGEAAGEFLFRGREFTKIPNAIAMGKFAYSSQVRKQTREALGVSDNAFVIGHVGRFFYPKNHEFLICIFCEVCKRKENAILLLIGMGEKETQIREQVKRLGLEEKVLFLGNRSDVAELYQAMDVFVLPSLFEGVPLVGIEAQTAGLPCVFSDKVPKEVKIADNSVFLSLKSQPKIWANVIVEFPLMEREKQCEKISDSQYNINHAVGILQEMYFKINI